MNNEKTIARTGVFCTEDEAKRFTQLAEEARKTPVIAFSSEHALRDGGLSGQAWRRVHESIHSSALAHGLPEIHGYYGCDLRNHEFVTS